MTDIVRFGSSGDVRKILLSKAGRVTTKIKCIWDFAPPQQNQPQKLCHGNTAWDRTEVSACRCQVH